MRIWLVLMLIGMTISHVAGQATVQNRLRQYALAARARLRPSFTQAHVAYPPAKLVLLGLKEESRLELYAPDAHGTMRFVSAYPILAASGRLGPKLREGDCQVPEGIYGIELLNPNSAYHLSLRISYPSAFDRRIARQEGRSNLGGDIMIHGNAVSAGCLAMGDEAAEDLFVLAADTGLPDIRVMLCPVDLRTREAPHTERAWVNDLYASLRHELQDLPAPPAAVVAQTEDRRRQRRSDADAKEPTFIAWLWESRKGRLALAIASLLTGYLLVGAIRAGGRKRRGRRAQQRQ